MWRCKGCGWQFSRIAWFAGSALLGALYDVSLIALVAVSIAAELAALVPFLMATRLLKRG
jgi:hypothetical protein